MKVSKIRKAVLLVIASGAFALGCELIVDFDRTKIPVEGSDSATVTPEASTDGSSVDSSQPDTSTVTDAGDEADALDAAEAATDAPDGD